MIATNKGSMMKSSITTCVKAAKEANGPATGIADSRML
eukprot:CAMPEP_0178805002 /NCGR_PEP_ID=MMETSP0745-20121128/15438_1 /TAXON_ID=913974 /ORGANISM="Nitzschia punctata, Strain CCMP561" /LENGTH=37 /DNA_ID= /DNA_START= /DNA_END= /DNA_ORIENTATION=